MRCRLVLSPVVLVLATSCVSPGPVRRAAERLPLEPCRIEGIEERLLCGRLSVWENREARSGRKISLKVVVAPALGEEVAADPLFVFNGGPGGAATELIGEYVAPGSRVRERRDIIFVDQRGTGGSHLLDCKLPGSADDPQGYLSPMLEPAAIRACLAELSTKADLRLYTTTIAADDLDEVRAWLGYERINLEGGSYGTRMAQVYLRRYPERVRTALLVGLAGMNQHLPLFHARDAKRALDLVLDDCLADPTCEQAFPDVKQELRAVLARLETASADVTLANPLAENHAKVTIEISRGAFAEDLRFLLYGAGTSVAAPLVIHEAFGGNFEPFVRLALLWEPAFRTFMAEGMHLSVTCAEDVPFIAPQDIAPAVEGTYLGDYRVRYSVAACASWPRGSIPGGYHEPVTANVPVLILSGRLDPVTPPSWAEEAARHLPNVKHLVLDQGHHGPGGLSNIACFERIAQDFLDRGTLEGLDVECIATMKRPAWMTERSALEKLLAGE